MRVIFVIACVILAAALAGCSTDETPLPATIDGPTIITDPTDLKNGTTPGSHIHDYWGGEETKTIINVTQQVGAGQGITFRFRPDDGVIAPPGSARAFLKLTWPSTATDATYTPPNIALKTNASIEYAPFGRATNGETIEVKLSSQDSDLPHSLLSQWALEVRYDAEIDIALSSFSAKVTVERGLEIPVSPPHPDHWQNETSLLLLDASDSATTAQAFGNGITPDPLGPFLLEDTIVPPGAVSLAIVIDIDSEIPIDIELQYTTARTREFQYLEASSRAGTTLFFEVPVGEGEADSPYAEHSLWTFYPREAVPINGQAWTGTLHVEITAHKEG